jgi:uncharacterized protein
VIVYADTSALVKLIVREAGSKDMLELRPQITVLATARIAYVELRAALAAMRRDLRLAPTHYRRARRQLEGVWRNTSPIEIDTELVTRAGELAERRALRGYDAVHLAALERLASPSQCLFACWDDPLRRAARSMRYRLFPTQA